MIYIRRTLRDNPSPFVVNVFIYAVMKKIYLLLGCAIITTGLFAQQQFGKVIKESFRVNPLGGTFPAFIKTLNSDPDLLNKEVVLKTDSTFYALKGEYKVFNPFNFPANKVEIIFAEDAGQYPGKKDSAISFTYYNYQIIVYCNDNVAYRNTVKKEYARIGRRIKRDLPIDEKTSLKGVKNVEDGEFTNYYNDYSIIHPVTISWQTLSASKQLALTFLLRMRIINNVAIPFGFGLSAYSNKEDFEIREDENAL